MNINFFDYYLKFADKTEAYSVLANLANENGSTYSLVGTDENGNEFLACSGSDDVPVVTPTGTMLTDSEGNEYPEMVKVAGYHVNVRSRRPIPELDLYNTNPITPQRSC